MFGNITNMINGLTGRIGSNAQMILIIGVAAAAYLIMRRRL